MVGIASHPTLMNNTNFYGQEASITIKIPHTRDFLMHED